MSFLKELEMKKIALKKTEGPRKENKLEKMIVEDESDYYRLMKETYFEAYYSQIEDFTFKSVIIPLSLEEIQALRESYNLFLTKDNNYDLDSVVAKVEEGITLIRKKTNSDCKVFIRLSSRSPKDAIYHLAGFQSLYQDKLQEFEDKEDVFSKLHAFYKASTEVMAISSGEEAAELLRMSERIQGDLDFCLTNKEPLNLIVREFVHFPVKSELRGFVYNGALTALSVYNNLAYFPEHRVEKSEVEAKVLSFMAEFIRAMESTLNNFIVDLALDDEGKVWVVEVNPFGELAGSCLFSWKNDRWGGTCILFLFIPRRLSNYVSYRTILMGEEPFEFRIVEEPPSLGYIKSEIDQRVLDILDVK